MGKMGNYYENEEEAKEVLLQLLEEKYQKKFTLTGESRYLKENPLNGMLSN